MNSAQRALHIRLTSHEKAWKINCRQLHLNYPIFNNKKKGFINKNHHGYESRYKTKSCRSFGGNQGHFSLGIRADNNLLRFQKRRGSWNATVDCHESIVDVINEKRNSEDQDNV